jgi:hypothetical protein
VLQFEAHVKVTLAALALTGCVLGVITTPVAAQTARIIPLATNDLVYDPVSGKLYASVPGAGGANGNSIAVIDPVTATVESYVWIGSEPSRLAVSSDGRYLYAALNGANAIRRLDLTTLTPGLQFAVGSGSYETYFAEDIAVVPGNPSAVAVVRRGVNSSGDGGVGLYVDGVLRPDVTPGIYGPRTLAFCSNAGQLCGYNNYTSGFELFRLNVTTNGVTVVDQADELFYGYGLTIHYANGLLFGSNGQVVDPEALAGTGRFTAPSGDGLSDVAVDSATHRAFALSQTSRRLRAFDLSTWTPLWSAPLAGTTGTWAALQVAGANRLAFRTTGSQVVVVDLAATQPLTILKRGTGDGSITSAPAGPDCGVECAALWPADAAVTLAATPAQGSTFVRWDGDADCADGSVTMSAARTCVAVFAETGNGYARSLPLPANDVVYDATRGRLYASVPSRVGPDGNAIAIIDPATASIESSIWVGSEPGRLAISDDGRYLYVALDGASAVRRIDLTTGVPGLQFAVGGGVYGLYYALDLAVVPGNASAVAVVRKSVTNTGDGGVGLYVDGVLCPNVSGPVAYGSRAIVFSSSPDRLYGADDYQFNRHSVTDAGVGLVDSTRGLTGGYSTRLRFAGGALYTATGRVVDPEALQPVARLPVATNETLSDVAPDLASGRVFALAATSGSSAGRLRAFDLATWRPIWSAPLPNARGTWSSLTTAGTGRLAFRTSSSQVVVVDVTSTWPLKVGKRGTGNGTVTSAPASLSCGSDCASLFAGGTTVTLSAAPASGSTFVGWQGDADCADGSVTMRAARSCLAVFVQTGTASLRELPVPASDIVYSPATGTLYASVPGGDPIIGNTVTAFDPLTGAIRSSLFVGSEPRKLALSADGLTLYVGVDGTASVRSLNLVSGALGAAIPLGRDTYNGPVTAQGLAVKPGDPSTFVVVRANSSSDYNGAIVSYSSGVQAGTAAAKNDVSDIFFGASSSRLYGAGAYAELVKMTVQPTGVTVDKITAVATGTNSRYQDGRVFTGAGRIIDAEAESLLGTFPLTTSYSAIVCPDLPRGVVYFLERPAYDQLALRVYDADRFTRRLSVPVAGVTGAPLTLITAGPGHLAFRTDTAQLYVLSHVNSVAARPARDFDGDLQADVAVYRPGTGTWFTLDSSTDRGTFGTRGWGAQAEGDIPVVGDFDGDGIVDPTVYRPSTGTWFVLESHANFTTWAWTGWGASDDTPVPGDYDGDGRADAAVYRSSTGVWYVRPSNGDSPWAVAFGEGDDVPQTGDFDGDGKNDLALYRPSTGTWFWVMSSTGFRYYDYVGWGLQAEGDRPAPGDYDGDGKTDPCVFRPSTGAWFVLESKQAYSTWSWFGWGQPGDTPVAADYDGDGRTDGAVYRPATGTWYVRPSSGASPWNVVFGQGGDVPLIK